MAVLSLMSRSCLGRMHHAARRLGWWLAAFLAFRLFDIVKIWPGSWFDRRMKSGLGVMLDDIAAAVYAWALIVLLSAAWQRWA